MGGLEACLPSHGPQPLPVVLLGRPSIPRDRKEKTAVLQWGAKATQTLGWQSAHWCPFLWQPPLLPGSPWTVSHTHGAGFLAVITPPVFKGEGLLALPLWDLLAPMTRGTDQLLAAYPTVSQAAERPLRALTKAGPCGQPVWVLRSQMAAPTARAYGPSSVLGGARHLSVLAVGPGERPGWVGRMVGAWVFSARL